jgi:hypothetical protein
MLSVLVRGVNIVAGILGVILPLTSKGAISILGLQFDGPAEAGYAGLLIAVLVLGLDHVFMISGTWIRYINALTKIRTIILKAEYEWQRMKSSMANDGAAHEQRDKDTSYSKNLSLIPAKSLRTKHPRGVLNLARPFKNLRD